MAVISKRRYYTVSALDKLGDFLRNVGRRFKNLADEIDNVFIIGDYLASPFNYVGDWFLYAEYYSRQANNYIKDVLEWVYTLVDGIGFIDLLKWVNQWFRWLISDQRYFFYRMLGDFLIEGLILYTNPRQWVINRLISYAYWFYSFLQSPRLFILARLFEGYFWLSGFLNNPTNTILNWLYSRFPLLSSLFSNPRLFILGKLFESYFFLNSFFSNPTQFIIDKIKSYSPFLYNLIMNRERVIYDLIRLAFGLPVTFNTDPIGTLFEAILNILERQFNRYGNRVKELVITIIKEFL